MIALLITKKRYGSYLFVHFPFFVRHGNDPKIPEEDKKPLEKIQIQDYDLAVSAVVCTCCVPLQPVSL